MNEEKKKETIETGTGKEPEKTKESEEIKEPTKEEIDKTLKEGKIEQKYLDLSELPKNKALMVSIPSSPLEEFSFDDIPGKPKPEPRPVTPKEIPDKTIEINIPKKEPIKPTETPPVSTENYSKSNLPKPKKEKKNKVWLIVKIISIALLLILLGISVYYFAIKDFSTDVDITNNAPDVNVENTYNHTIENNNTIIIQIDEDIIEEIAERILDELNITNSS